MKNIFATVIFMVVALMLGASVPGVDRNMALSRKSKISNLTYTVSFNVPETVKADVCGKTVIGFDYKPSAGDTLEIDFRGDAGQFHGVKVNGKKYAIDFRNEHIHVADRDLRQGHNDIEIDFIAGDRSLNRRDDFMYTLFVPDRARTTFPVFDQPDMKASYSLTLDLPAEWKAVSNSPVVSEKQNGNRKTIVFAPTEQLSSYLFSFAAGKFEYVTATRGGRTIGAYYRETDPVKVAQLPDIFDDVFKSLEWLEDFTSVPYPFAKYDLVILPGFQFGGMEHTGATFYNDNTLFLPANPTPDERMHRSQLIAHETSHMWFGDYVTMEWFNDVWTKEVFANYFGANITRDLLPRYDHDLEWMRNYAAAALSEDRSEGGTTIRQNLDNLNNAGLIYNNIIYNKAPVMLAKIVELTGKDAFREGIREYVRTYAYGNATWDDLVEILQRHTDADVKGFSRVWVYEKGMPHVGFAVNDGVLTVTQTDPRGKGNLWPQQFAVTVIGADGTETVNVRLDGEKRVIKYPVHAGADATILPNSDGRGYGLFTLEPDVLEKNMAMMADSATVASLPVITRLATMMNLNENYLAGNIPADRWLGCLKSAIAAEPDELSSNTLIGYMAAPMLDIVNHENVDRLLLDIAKTHPHQSTRTNALRLLISYAQLPEAVDYLEKFWRGQTSSLLNERDYMNLSYTLAMLCPERSAEILAEQRSRLTNPDRQREFDFVSKAVAPTAGEREAMFGSLLMAENRTVEPWARTALKLLNHPVRREEAVAYIYPALSVLPEVQRTGDIFFPANWCKALLSDHRGDKSKAEVYRFLDDNPGLKPLLKNKILNALR